MAEIKKISTELQLLNKFLDTSGDAGTSGQVLSSTGTGINWVSGGSLPGGPYLPLSAGLTKPLTGNLYINDSIPKLIFTDTDTSTVASISANSSNLTYTTATSARDHIFKAGTDTLVTIEGTGNVGIGTTSPTQKLHVVSSSIVIADFNTTSTKGGIKIHEADEGGFLSTEANRICLGSDIGISNNNLSYHMGTNSLGIGTASPGAKLDVVGAVRSSEGTDYTELKTDGGDTLIANVSTDANNIRLFNGGSERMRITSAGKVGIGTTNPGTALQVGDGTADDTIRTVFSDGSYTDVHGYGLYMSRTDSYIRPVTDETQTLRLGDNGKTWNNIIHNANLHTFNNDTSEWMRITSAGNVGIGTTSPISKFTVTGTDNTNQANIGHSTQSVFIKVNGTNVDYNSSGNSGGSHTFSTGNVERMRIEVGGNVGIGTTSPGYPLEVKSAYPFVTTNSTGTGNSGFAMLVNAGSNGVGVIATDNGGSLTFDNGATGVAQSEKMRITSGGNVGIGTTNPSEKLEVDGNIKLTGNLNVGGYISPNDESGNLSIFGGNDTTNDAQILLHGSSNYWGSLELNYGYDAVNSFFKISQGTNEHLRITNGGKVGIGTTSPTFKLHVNSTDASDNVAYIHHNNAAQSSGDVLKVRSDAGDNAGSALLNVANNTGSALYVRGDRNVGIGTTSPGSSLEVLKSASSTTISEARISSLVTGGYGGQANLWLRTSTYGSAMLAFGPQVGSSTVASSASGKISYNTFNRIFTVTADSNALLTLGGSNDRVGINQTSPQYTLDVTGNGRFTSTVTATNFINSSDERLKENIEEVCNNNVEVNWKTFNFKTEKEQKRYGVIAQELEKTNPEFVREDSQGFKSVAYIDLLIAKIAELEARIQKLEK